MEKELRVLLVDDDEDDYVLLREMFARLPGQGNQRRYCLEWVNGFDEALAACVEQRYDIHLVDYHLGQRNGLDLMRAATEKGCNAPTILLTGQGSYELDLAAMQLGVYDYLLKGQLNEYVLERSIRYALERRQARADLEDRVLARTHDLAAANEELKREIARRTEVEAELRASESRFRALAETTSAAIFIVQDGQIRYANPAALYITGYRPEELVGTELWRLAHPSYQATLREDRLVSHWSRNVPARYELKIINKKGEERWVDLTAGIVEVEDRPTWVFTAFDITERDLAEQALRKARDDLELRVVQRTSEIRLASQRLETILRTLPVAVVMADEKGKITSANGAFLELWDSPVDLPVELRDWEAFQAWDGETGTRLGLHDWPLARAIFQGETVIGQVIDILTVSGQRKTILNAAVPLFRPDGGVSGGVAVAQDITHQRQLEQAANEAAQVAQRRAEELEGLHRATAALLSTLDLDELLRQILDAALSAIPAAEHGMLHLVAPPTGQLHALAALGFHDERVFMITSLAGPGYPARVARERRPLLVEDIQQDELLGPEGSLPGEMEGARSIIIAPLLYSGNVLGALSLISGQPGAFSGTDLRLLASFAATTTAALQNALLHAEIKQLAVTDPLTGQLNRRAFFDLGQRELDRFLRYGHPLSAVMIDLDNFKQINDTYGHKVGDEILIMLARLVRASIRETDIFGRYGGDEFSLFLPDTSLPTAVQIARRIREIVFDTPFQSDQGSINVSISVGVAQAEKQHHTPDDLLAAADRALYRAKALGRNRVEVNQ
jgi:diguanylate cyclase (GGDEF)-like protein/PAS domain S-box-containing protein